MHRALRVRVLGVFDATAESLSDLAACGRVVPEVADIAIREVFVYRYRLIYQVGTDDVRILAVIPGAMDYRAWMRRP
jgi:toxin ParE1/3/4